MIDRESRLETIIGILLIVGVVLSVSFEIIGIILYFGAYGNATVSEAPGVHIASANFFAFIYQTFQNLFVSQNALLFLTSGIIILILTPYIRAITSLVYFTWEKNQPYILITLFVIIVLTISLALH